MKLRHIDRHLVSAGFIAFGCFAAIQPTHADMLYSASLKNGVYGGGFIVDTFAPDTCFNRSGLGCGDGDLRNIGITNSAAGVVFTSNNAVINYSIGADYPDKQSGFRLHGTVSVWFKADRENHVTGQPFTDNYGFNQFNSGQGSFGAGMSRDTKGTSGKGDDEVLFTWTTWHDSVWYSHTPSPVRASYDTWHNLGLAWDGALNKFEVWVDGELKASQGIPSERTRSWGSGFLGSAYNFALGEIHERAYGNSSVYGVVFADLTIWDEYRAFGNTTALIPIPEPESYAMLLAGLGLLGYMARRRKRLA